MSTERMLSSPADRRRCSAAQTPLMRLILDLLRNVLYAAQVQVLDKSMQWS